MGVRAARLQGRRQNVRLDGDVPDGVTWQT